MTRARIVEECHTLSLHVVLREHRRGRSAPFVVSVSLESAAGSVQVRCGSSVQGVPLMCEPHNLSGTRWYCICECGARTFTLYWPLDATRLRCRACYGLRYRGENLSTAGRLEHRASKLARRLGGSLLRPSVRAKGMWHSTFLRRQQAAYASNVRALEMRLSCAA
jgi:hypothetical protein